MINSEARRLKGNAAVKARQERYLSEGLCRCGHDTKSGLNSRDKPYTMCESCVDKQDRKLVLKPAPPKSPENWHTNQFYRVTTTGEIGEQIECPCTDPIVLEFKDGVRDAFHLRELEPTTHRSTALSPARGGTTKNGLKGSPKGIAPRTIERMLQIHAFLMDQSNPVYRAVIEDAVGFNITRCMMGQPSLSQAVTMESLGVVERIKGERTWIAWQLSQRGRDEGAAIIKSVYTQNAPLSKKEACLTWRANKEIKGICTRCGVKPQREGMMTCGTCTPLSHRKRSKQWRQELKAKGLCTICGNKPAEVSTATCAPCKARARESMRKKRESTRHLCSVCNSRESSDPEHRTCDICLQRGKSLRDRSEAKGLCNRCRKRPPRVGLKSCEVCAIEMASAAKRYQLNERKV